MPDKQTSQAPQPTTSEGGLEKFLPQAEDPKTLEKPEKLAIKTEELGRQAIDDYQETEEVIEKTADIAETPIDVPEAKKIVEAENSEKIVEEFCDKKEVKPEHRERFLLTAEKLFGELVARCNYKYSEKNVYHPLLNELNSILASIQHNSGVNYEDEDVLQIFEVLSEELLRDLSGVVKPLLKPDKPLNESYEIKLAIDEQIQLICSESEDRSITIEKGQEWKKVSQKESPEPKGNRLEFIRKDAQDKADWRKYRVRKVDSKDSQSWEKSPNYWSKELRDMLIDISTTAEEQELNIMLVSEGGIYKGTSTAGTDLDTHCFIFCAEEERDQVRAELEKIYTQRQSRLPFKVSDQAHLWYSGEDENTREVSFELRRPEKGITIIKNGELNLYKKPENTQKALLLKINTDSLDVNFEK